MTALFLIGFAYLIRCIFDPTRVRFNKYTEHSFFNPDGSDRGVVVIDTEWRDHPDYHAPDAVRRYPREQAGNGAAWVKRLAWASFFLVVIVVASYGVS